jgi:RNA polymerase sigma-70 factor (ECF subfamily)
MATNNTDEFIPTRQSLLSRLKDWHDEQSWKAFFETYWKLIYGVARKSGLNDAEAQDVVQETVISVAKKMPDFKYDPAVGSFKGWLMQLTRWRITDQVRKKQYEKDGKRYPREEALSTALMETCPDNSAVELEKIWDQEWQKNIMEIALEKAKRRVTPAQFQMFHLHVVKKIPARTVAQRLNVKLPEVYFAKYKTSAFIRKEIQHLEKKML